MCIGGCIKHFSLCNNWYGEYFDVSLIMFLSQMGDDHHQFKYLWIYIFAFLKIAIRITSIIG